MHNYDSPTREGGARLALPSAPRKERRGGLTGPAPRRLDFGSDDVVALPLADGAARSSIPMPAVEKESGAARRAAKVAEAYSIIRRSTGQIGGNGSGGAIYGETTVKSFQKVVDVLKARCGLDTSSKFIDVGSGLGKPNLHVAQDPGVALSYGVEMEEVRWQLSMHNLNETVKRATVAKCDSVYFQHGDITQAATLDPFTHVYMFDVGFPPPLLMQIAQRFNQSRSAKYLISFQTPRRVIDDYGFQVEHVEKIANSMHGSSEKHSCYVYERTADPPAGPPRCDPLFQPAVAVTGSVEDHGADLTRRLTAATEPASGPRRSARNSRSSSKSSS